MGDHIVLLPAKGGARIRAGAARSTESAAVHMPKVRQRVISRWYSAARRAGLPAATASVPATDRSRQPSSTRKARWGGYQELHPDQLGEARRTFYVAVTRAKQAVVILHGDFEIYRTSWFVKDIRRQLNSAT
jgi:superfamily I DNA/RNA helicase